MYKNDFSFTQFNDDGYTVINNAFPADDLQAFRKTFQNIVAHVLKRAAKEYPALNDAIVGEHCNEGLLALRHTAKDYLAVAQRLISRSPEFFRLSSTPKVFNIIRELMNITEESPLYLLSNGIVFTPPNDLEKRSTNFKLGWHQDTFFTIPRSQYFQFWGPVLQASTTETGTLQVCPRSHKDGYGKQKIEDEKIFNQRYAMVEGEAEKYDHVSVELELGQLLIFHGQLIHASGNNTSRDQIRSTILGLCHNAAREECVPVSTHYLYHGETPEQWFYNVYKDENVKPLMYEQLAEVGEPVGGI